MAASGSLSAALGHLGAVVWFAAIAMGLTAPVWQAPSSSVIGTSLADNTTFVWNFWWAKLALHDPARTLFSTDLLFAPLGTSLVLNTGTPLLTVLSAIALPRLDAVDTYNLWIALGLFLNGVCAYLAAYHLTGRRGAALLAGTIFGAVPFLVVRANGHLNLLSAWGLPLLVLLSDRLQRRPSVPRAIATGTMLGAIALIDYYYFIYALLLEGIRYLTSRWTFHVVRTPTTAWRHWIVRAALVMMVVAVIAALVIALTGGWDVSFGTKRISMRGTFNMRVLIGYLALFTLLAHFGPRVRRATADGGDTNRHVAVIAIVALVVIAPLVAAAVHMWMTGDYVAPKRFWRSASSGLDAATLVMGNPTSAFFGSYSRALYTHFDIDRIERIGWLGVVPTALLIIGIRQFRQESDVRRWLIALVVFGLWALGPYLTVLGTNTGLMLPQTIVNFIPIVNNARMPSRAYVIVILAVAMIAAFVVSHSRSWLGRRWWAAWLLAGLTLVDYWPQPFRTTRLDRSPIDEALARAPQGVVLELPLGLRDGFGERGRFDHQSLYSQTLHGHPLVGGFVARLSARIVDNYTNDAVFAPLLDLAEGTPDVAADRRLASPADTLACSIRYVVLPSDLDGRTLAFIVSVFRLEPLAETKPRSLYAVTGFQPPYCEAHASAGAS